MLDYAHGHKTSDKYKKTPPEFPEMSDENAGKLQYSSGFYGMHHEARSRPGVSCGCRASKNTNILGGKSTMSEGVVLNPTRLVLAALIGLVILLVLIIKFNVQAMIAILIGAICIGLLAGMPTQDIISAVTDGIGNT